MPIHLEVIQRLHDHHYDPDQQQAHAEAEPSAFCANCDAVPVEYDGRFCSEDCEDAYHAELALCDEDETRNDAPDEPTNSEEMEDED